MNLADCERRGSFLHSRRFPQKETDQEALARRMVVSKLAATETPDKLYGHRIVDVGKEAKKRAEWRQATGASAAQPLATGKSIGWILGRGNLQMPCLHSSPPPRRMSQHPKDRPKANAQSVQLNKV